MLLEEKRQKTELMRIRKTIKKEVKQNNPKKPYKAFLDPAMQF